MEFRTHVVPFVQFAGQIAPWLFVAGLMLQTDALTWSGVILFGSSFVFALLTLPVEFDASKRFGVEHIVADEPQECIAGEVLQGLIKPNECEAFGNECTPRKPLGATMVSTEGACAAYFHYGRARRDDADAPTRGPA